MPIKKLVLCLLTCLFVTSPLLGAQKTVDQQQKELDDQLKAVLAQDPHLARENDRPKTVPSKQQDKDY